MLCHQVKRVGKILIGPHSDELARRNLPARHPSRILVFGDRPDDRVAIGDHSHEPVPVEDGNRPYVLGLHQLGDLAELRIGRRAARTRVRDGKFRLGWVRAGMDSIEHGTAA